MLARNCYLDVDQKNIIIIIHSKFLKTNQPNLDALTWLVLGTFIMAFCLFVCLFWARQSLLASIVWKAAMCELFLQNKDCCY